MHNHTDQYDMHWARIDRDYINVLEEELPGVRKLIRFQDYQPRDFKAGEESFRVEFAYTSDADVFEVFDFRLIAGDPATALRGPNRVVLTESMSEKFFGTSNSLGRDLYLLGPDQPVRYEVTGIMEDIDERTHLPVNLLTSFPSQEARTGWAYTYLLLDSPSYAEQVAAYLPGFIRKFGNGDSPDEISFHLQSLKSIHLESNLAREIVPNSRWEYVWVFLLAGLVVYFLSMTNYLNLQLAEAIQRQKGVGIRRILGSGRGALLRSQAGEAVGTTIISGAVALLLYLMLREKIGSIARLATPDLWFIAGLLLPGIFLAVICKLYPAMLLLRSHPVSMLKKQFASGSQTLPVRNVLVGVQLVLCVVVVSTVFILTKQLTYMAEQNITAHGDQVLAIRNIPDEVRRSTRSIKDALEQQSGVVSLSQVMEIPSRDIRDAGPVTLEGKNWSEEEQPVMDIQVADSAYFNTMGYQLLAGQFFSREKSFAFPEDLLDYLISSPREYIINRTALEMLGYTSPEEVLGKQISWSIGDIRLQEGPVIGVVEDYHQENLRNRIDALVIIQEPVWTRNMLIRVKPGSVSEVRSAIKATWALHAPDHPLEVEFLDDLFARHYSRENDQILLMRWMQLFVILIAFSGIIALFDYLIRSRQKELVIRKVLGAGMKSLGWLISGKLVVSFLAGFLISIPITWYLVQQWLDQYAYRIPVPVNSFLISAGLVLVVLLLLCLWMLRRLDSGNPATILAQE